MITCPTCHGEKECFVFENRGDHPHTSGYRPCFTCNGAGEITDEHKARIEQGRKLKQDRYDRKETLIDCASRLGITVVELSAIENGRSI